MSMMVCLSIPEVSVVFSIHVKASRLTNSELRTGETEADHKVTRLPVYITAIYHVQTPLLTVQYGPVSRTSSQTQVLQVTASQVRTFSFYDHANFNLDDEPSIIL